MSVKSFWNNRNVTHCEVPNGNVSSNERDVGNGSGALLDMLAEVASQTLHSDPTVKSPSKTHNDQKRKKVSYRSRIGENEMVDLNTIRTLSGNLLVKLFSEFDGDEMRRTFTYSCFLEPEHCKIKFSSFGSEVKARQNMKNHLLEHVQQLQEDAGSGVKFAVETVKVRRKRLADQVSDTVNKKKRGGLKSHTNFLLKDEGSNENDSSITNKVNSVNTSLPSITEENKIDKDTSQAFDVYGMTDKCSLVSDICFDRILYEHSYTSISTKEETEDSISVVNSTDKFLMGDGIAIQVADVQSAIDGSPAAELGRFMVAETLNDMVMVCVMEDNQLQLKQLPCVGQEIDIDTSGVEECFKIKPEDSPESTNESQKVSDCEKCVERVKKPKGKAKFIGQSKAEKEMAIHLIDKMRRKETNSLACRICNPPRIFTASTTLISHYRSHAGIKPYECRICQSVFTRQHSLNYHMLIHSNQTRFTCVDCGRKFRHPSHFKEHRRRHTGESPYECSDCTLRFKTRNTYKRHLKTRHGKVLTTSGSLIILSEEEFQRVRTLPRSRQNTGYSISDKQARKLLQRGHGLTTINGSKQYVSSEFQGKDYEKNVGLNMSKSMVCNQKIKGRELISLAENCKDLDNDTKEAFDYNFSNTRSPVNEIASLPFTERNGTNIVEQAIRQSNISFTNPADYEIHDLDTSVSHTDANQAKSSESSDIKIGCINGYSIQFQNMNHGETLVGDSNENDETLFHESQHEDVPQSALNEESLILPGLNPLVINSGVHKITNVHPILSKSSSFPQALTILNSQCTVSKGNIGHLSTGLNTELIGIVDQNGVDVSGPQKATIMLLTSDSSCGLSAQNLVINNLMKSTGEPISISQH